MDRSIKQVSTRFGQAMKTIIAEKIMAGEKYNMNNFADSIGYTRSNLPKIIHGSRNVNLPMILKMCDVHNISPNWLIKGIGEMKLKKIEKNGKKISLEERVRKLEGLVKLNTRDTRTRK